jgi:DNA repair exonuclease SbcCD ATPase subunit
MAKIIKIYIEGFGSILGKIKYKFDRPGISLILGKNGAGKTTIFNALSWALYGQLLKPKSTFQPWPHITPEEYRGCRVRVEVEGGIEIIRCADFKGKVAGKKGGNRLIILQDGVDRADLRGKVDAQREINKIIGYTFPLFKTAVLFAQELGSIIEEDGPQKKKIFEEAFESAFISRAKEIVDKTLKTLEDEYKDLTTKTGATREMLESNRNILESLEQQIHRFANEKARKIADLRKRIRGYKKENTSLKEGKDIGNERKQIKQDLKDLGLERDRLNQQSDPRVEKMLIHTQGQLRNYEKELGKVLKDKRMLNKDQPVCNSCGATLGGKRLAFFKKNLEKQREKIKDQEKYLKGMIKITRKGIEDLQKSASEQSYIAEQIHGINIYMGEMEDRLKSLDRVWKKMASNKVTMRELKRQINETRKSKNTLDTSKVKADIEKLTQTLSDNEGRLKKINEKMELQRWLIKDPLSNSGLKAFIFDSMLRKVNYYLQQYTQYIGFRVKVAMDLESANKDFMITIEVEGAEVSFNDLSRGQKQLVKVALCFAINDSIDNVKPINILLMDELFESLDPENVEIVGSIIEKKAKTRSIHIITHKSKFNPIGAYKTFIILNAQKQTVIEQKYKAA